MSHPRTLVGASAVTMTLAAGALARAFVRDAARSDLAAPALVRARTRDSGFQTYDRRTIDSTGAFLIGELERLDQEQHGPLYDTTWGRDIDLREDVSMGDEVSSFTNSTFASIGGTTPGGKSWASKAANQIAGISLDIGKTPNPLTLWAQELKYSLPELESAIRAGRPIDVQKYDGLTIKHDMDIDEQVYIGDAELNLAGLTNSPLVTPANVPNGSGGSPLWKNKNPDEITSDINDVLNASWTATGYSVVPGKLLLAPLKFSYLVSQKVSNAGNVSILEYVRQNCIANARNGKPLDIQPVKWLTGRGVGGTDRMVAYTQQKNRVRFPLVPLQRTPLEYRSLYQITTYYGRLGAVEFVYPETVAYSDGM